MPPTGGPTRRGPDTSPASVEALEEFFAGSGEAGPRARAVVCVGRPCRFGGRGAAARCGRRPARSGLVVAGDFGVPSRGVRLATGTSARRRSSASDRHGAALSSRTRLARVRLDANTHPGECASARPVGRLGVEASSRFAKFLRSGSLRNTGASEHPRPSGHRGGKRDTARVSAHRGPRRCPAPRSPVARGCCGARSFVDGRRCEFDIGHCAPRRAFRPDVAAHFRPPESRPPPRGDTSK